MNVWSYLNPSTIRHCAGIRLSDLGGCKAEVKRSYHEVAIICRPPERSGTRFLGVICRNGTWFVHPILVTFNGIELKYCLIGS